MKRSERFRVEAANLFWKSALAFAVGAAFAAWLVAFYLDKNAGAMSACLAGSVIMLFVSRYFADECLRYWKMAKREDAYDWKF